jgi:hypothetical protein
VLGPDEPLLGRPVEQLQQRREVPGGVEDPARLVVHPELGPGHGLAELVERAEPAGQHDEPVAQVGHTRFALVHGRHDLQLGQAGVRDLGLDQRGGHDAGHLAAGRQAGVGQRAHQAEVSAAVDEPDAPAGQFPPQRGGGLDVDGVGAGAGAAEHGEAGERRAVHRGIFTGDPRRERNTSRL